MPESQHKNWISFRGGQVKRLSKHKLLLNHKGQIDRELVKIPNFDLVAIKCKISLLMDIHM
jgi:hypothetical protein